MLRIIYLVLIPMRHWFIRLLLLSKQMLDKVLSVQKTDLQWLEAEESLGAKKEPAERALGHDATQSGVVAVWHMVHGHVTSRIRSTRRHENWRYARHWVSVSRMAT